MTGLTLHREALADLTPGELAVVAGGTVSATCPPPGAIGVTTGTWACPTSGLTTGCGPTGRAS